MKKLLLMALAATALFACSKQGDENPSLGKNLKISIGSAKVSTKSIEPTVDGYDFTAAVKNNIADFRIVMYGASGNEVMSFRNPTQDQIDAFKADKFMIHDVPETVASVQVFINENVTTSNKINDHQGKALWGVGEENSLKYMTTYQFEGRENVTITNKVDTDDNNTILEAIVNLHPSLTRFEVAGTTGGMTISSIPPTASGTKTVATNAGFNDVQITAAEELAKAAWRSEHPGQSDPNTWNLQYTVTYTEKYANTPVKSYDGVWMNYFRGSKLDKNIIKNTNDAAGDWSATSKTFYETGGDGSNMWDNAMAAWKDNNVNAFNLFPQYATNWNSDIPTIKSTMPHVIFKLTMNKKGGGEETRWVTVRAFQFSKGALNAEGTTTWVNSNDNAITAFLNGKAYQLDLKDIDLTLWIKTLTVTADGTTGGGVDDDDDPTDPDPEMEGFDLAVKVEIKKWDMVSIKPIL